MPRRSIKMVLNDEECAEIVKKKLQRDAMDEFSLVSYEIIPIDATTGFMGQYFNLKTIVAHDNSPIDIKEMNFFTKLPPPSNTPLYEFNEEHGSFTKEVELYTRVFPEVLHRLDDYSIIPECFLGSKNDIIVLEDMTDLGYEMADKFIPFDLNHCTIVMRTLAKFHAESLIFEALNEKNINDEFSQCLHETLFPMKDGLGKKMLDAAIKGISSLIDLVTGLNEYSKKELKRKMEVFCSNHPKMLLPSKKFKNVLCHGDLWANNILFKYGPTNEPIECCLIDFQLVRYNPPAHDILCFLQFTTMRKFRDKHANDLFKIYHESLAASLTEAGLNYETILSWEEFQQSIDELRTMCMVHGIINLTLMQLEPETVDKYFVAQVAHLENILYIDRTPLLCEEYHSIKRYKDRITDAVVELHDRILANYCT